MNQQEFNQLLKRYLEGNTTEQEDQLLTKWYEEPTNQVEIQISDSQKEIIKKRMWQSVRSQIRDTTQTKTISFAWISGIAACLLLGAFWFYTQSVGTSEKLISSLVQEQTGIEVKNTNASEQEVSLPDGTTVLLTQHSSLVYEKTFNQAKRVVYLNGEAFFKVKKDVTKPFIVHTGDLVTEVLGTSFWIRQDKKVNTTEVSVSTGKVSVYTQNTAQKRNQNGVIITPNQRVLYDATTRNITPSIVENPVVVSAEKYKSSSLLFKEAAFEHVLSELNQIYGIEFVISNSSVKGCQITADLNGLSMFTQLELICKSIDATYEIRGTVVFIRGSGCQ